MPAWGLALSIGCNRPNTENPLSHKYADIKSIERLFPSWFCKGQVCMCSYSPFSWGQLLDKVFSVYKRWLMFFKTSFKYHYLLLWKTNTLITTIVFGELFIWGLFEQCQIFMNNTCIHFEWKVLSGTLPKHETCQNYLHLFAESPESVFRSMASLLPCTLYALALLDWAKIPVK